MEKSDPLYYVLSGAGSPEVNGTYVRDGESIRNGSRVYKMSKDGVVRFHPRTARTRASMRLVPCATAERSRAALGPSSQNPVPNSFMFSRECVSGGEGFILGKAPRAWYAFQSKDRVCPETGWSTQEHGKEPVS